MAKLFTTPAAADIAFSNITNALLKKLEMKGTVDTVSDWTDFGEFLDDAEITVTPEGTTLTGARKFATIYKIEIKVNLICSGTNMRTALGLLMGNAVDTRLTDINGVKYTFTSAQAIPMAGITVKGGASGGSTVHPITISGTLTAAQWNAAIV